MSFLKRNKKDVLVLLAIFVFWVFAYYFRNLPLSPPGGIAFFGDTQSYVNSVNFLETGTAGPDFLPNRLLTNFAYLRLLILFKKLGNIYLGWILLNSLFYILSGFIFYKIIHKIFQSDKAAIVGTVLFLGNYVGFTFGLHYLTDIGSVMFYLLAAFFTLDYLYTNKEANIYLASVVTGVGGLFKEHAMGGYIMISSAILYVAYIKREKFLKNILLSTLISFVPIALVQVNVYWQYHYSYLDWYRLLVAYPGHAYKSRTVEHLKAFIYLYNVGYLLFFYSLYLMCKDINKYFNREAGVFIMTVLLSGLPIIFYPGITERLDFILVPFLILVSCMAVKEHESKWLWLFSLLTVYLLISFFMDSYILQPEWKRILIDMVRQIL